MLLTFPRRYISSLTAVNVYLWLFQMFYATLYIQRSYGSAPQILLKGTYFIVLKAISIILLQGGTCLFFILVSLIILEKVISLGSNNGPYYSEKVPAKMFVSLFIT